jgi:hypothetical protein
MTTDENTAENPPALTLPKNPDPLAEAGKSAPENSLAGIFAQSTRDSVVEHAAAFPRKVGRPKGKRDSVRRKSPSNPHPSPRPAGEPAGATVAPDFALEEDLLAGGEAPSTPIDVVPVAPDYDEKTARTVVAFILDGYLDLKGEIVRFVALRICGDEKIANETAKPMAKSQLDSAKEFAFLWARQAGVDFKNSPAYMLAMLLALDAGKSFAKLRMLKNEFKNPKNPGA